MSFLQVIPESGQLFLLGVGLFFMGALLRRIRRVLSDYRTPLSSKAHPEAKQS